MNTENIHGAWPIQLHDLIPTSLSRRPYRPLCFRPSDPVPSANHADSSPSSQVLTTEQEEVAVSAQALMSDVDVGVDHVRLGFGWSETATTLTSPVSLVYRWVRAQCATQWIIPSSSAPRPFLLSLASTSTTPNGLSLNATRPGWSKTGHYRSACESRTSSRQGGCQWFSLSFFKGGNTMRSHWNHLAFFCVSISHLTSSLIPPSCYSKMFNAAF